MEVVKSDLTRLHDSQPLLVHVLEGPVPNTRPVRKNQLKAIRSNLFNKRKGSGMAETAKSRSAATGEKRSANRSHPISSTAHHSCTPGVGRVGVRALGVGICRAEVVELVVLTGLVVCSESGSGAAALPQPGIS
jgi:hypothetical protein